MPMYIHNEAETMSEDDDAPVPSNVSSRGSNISGTSHVYACGNQVLELMEKHRKEIRARMENRERSFKGMLEQDVDRRRLLGQANSGVNRLPRNGSRSSSGSRSNYSSRASLSHSHGGPLPFNNIRETTSDRGNNTVEERYVQAYLSAVNHENDPFVNHNHSRNQQESHYHLQNVTSDEYMELPQSSTTGKTQPISNELPIKKNSSNSSRTSSGSRRHSTAFSPIPTETQNYRRLLNLEHKYSGDSMAPRARTSSSSRSPQRHDCIYDPEDFWSESNASWSEVEDDETRKSNRENNNRVSFSHQVIYDDPTKEEEQQETNFFHGDGHAQNYYKSPNASALSKTVNDAAAIESDRDDDDDSSGDGTDTDNDMITVNYSTSSLKKRSDREPEVEETSNQRSSARLNTPEDLERENEAYHRNVSPHRSQINHNPDPPSSEEEGDGDDDENNNTIPLPITRSAHGLAAYIRSLAWMEAFEFCQNNIWNILGILLIIIAVFGLTLLTANPSERLIEEFEKQNSEKKGRWKFYDGEVV